MIPHIHQALRQVKELRKRVLENQLFEGFSARARVFGALAAILGALFMQAPFFPSSISAHVVGWGAVCAFACVCNYGDVLLWYTAQPSERKELARLRPVVDGLPPILLGGVLTYSLLVSGQSQLLFGSWMSLFGLTHLSSRRSMPSAIWWLGWYYFACGSAFLIHGGTSFTNPWPMGIVFFLGEMAGANILFQEEQKRKIANSTSETSIE